MLKNKFQLTEKEISVYVEKHLQDFSIQQNNANTVKPYNFFVFYLGLLEDCGHCITLKVTDAPSHLETGGSKMFVADILVSRGGPVLPSHVPQPLLQPDSVL